MIVYRKGATLKLVRHTAPDPPFWAAGTLLPYSLRRSTPIALDWMNLIASGTESEQVDIADAAGETVARSPFLHSPLLVDATGPAELIYRRGEEVVRAATDAGLAVIELITTEGAVPEVAGTGLTLAIGAWPPDRDAVRPLALEAAERGITHGIVIPIVPPTTTELPLLEALADVALESGARFLAAVPIDVDPTARNVLAAQHQLDEEGFANLFDSDLELLTVATERHVAALAAERKLADVVPFDVAPDMVNWSAAAALSSAGNRMIRMNRNVELGWEIHRASKTIAALGKPLERIASAASLSIIEPIDPIIAEVLEEWLERGRAELLDDVDRTWRLRRDYLA
ncbi:MAG: hypothetical protein ACRD2J_15790 [Thermoanaerobaculia bacterium]